jgi:hypothetical protein
MKIKSDLADGDDDNNEEKCSCAHPFSEHDPESGECRVDGCECLSFEIIDDGDSLEKIERELENEE